MKLQLGQKSDEYPFGYGICQCGCGKTTPILYNGEHCRYRNSRHDPKNKAKAEKERRKREQLRLRLKRVQLGLSSPPFTNTTGAHGDVLPGYEKGWGFCQCGCGGRTNITRRTAARFLHGHCSRTAEARERSSRTGTALLRRRMSDPSLGFGRSTQGSHFSALNDRQMSFMSTYERRAFEILDVLDSVETYEEQPYSIPYDYHGAKAQYTPDVIIRFKDKRAAILEVKPRSKLMLPKVVAKAQAAAAFCQARGLQYMIWTEDFLRLQDFKREAVSGDGTLAQYCRLDYIERIIRKTVHEIDTLLAARRRDIHATFHPRA